MPTRYTNRVVYILLALWICVSAIYPRVPGSLLWFFDMKSPISTKTALKPGIDMVGGTSLTYEIKQPEGAATPPDLADKMATTLKERVDPQGVKNLVWRPQGSTRLEIQMPLTGQSAEGQKLRDDYEAAKTALEATNVRVATVIDDVESAPGPDRDKKIAADAQDSATRKSILDQMVKLSDQIKAARAAKNPQAAAEARLKYDPLQEQLNDTNLTVAQVESALEVQGAARDAAIKALKDKFQDFPSRLKAIDNLVVAYDAYAKVRNTLGDAAELKRLLRGSGVLSFYILANDISPEVQQQWVEKLRQSGPKYSLGDPFRWFEAGRPEEFVRRGGQVYNGKVYVLCHVDPESSMTNGNGQPKWAVESVHAGQDQSGGNAVDFQFDPRGAQMFGELTTRYKEQNGVVHNLALVLDNKLISAPTLPDRPIFGNVQISSQGGGFSNEELNYLVNTLSAGSLPAQLTDEPISEVTVGPSLGSDNLRRGFISCGLGLVVVFIFLTVYYYTSGLVAFLAVLANLILILGIMAIIQATFTLPGVAGVVLSVAIAVDANVLIFERLREEQARGLGIKMAMHNSYDRAFSAIFDGQITTAISSVFLFWFGSEEVRGFGLTLLIGIVTSLFTALYVTKTVFGILIDKFHVKDFSSLPRTFPKWNQMLHPKINWLKLAPVFLVFSAIFIGGGLLCFGIKYAQGQALDIEFSGGTAVRVALLPPKPGQQPLDRAAMQELIDAQSLKTPTDLAAPRAVAIGTDNREYEISTPTTDSKAVQAAVVAALGDRLDIEKPSKFDGVDQNLDTVENKLVHPIESASTTIPGVPAYLTQGHVGGVAIELNQLDPPLDAKTIKSRILARADQEKQDTRPEQVEVETFDHDTKGVVIFSDQRYAYDPTQINAQQTWREDLAKPAWQIVKDAVNNPPQLKSVTSFNAQVATEAKTNTLTALGLSIVGIMAYIWFRFGNLKFGTAAVVACIHDAAFVLAAVGFSLYLGQWEVFEKALLIHPFRVDLTLVAAILTVAGYSLNDTVVIFDRVRENRGKLATLSPQVVNDSINQTFSRTLLTGGTSMGILLIMYLFGGEGIHGFTFVMLLGIIVGTYSSVAVAAPMLLVGKPMPQSQPGLAGRSATA